VSTARSKHQLSLPPTEVMSIDRRSQTRSTDVDQDLALLRRAVADCNYTLDAMESAMGKGRAYIHKVLQGDKPMSHEFEIALPDDVEARYRQLQAEAFGHVVVTPAPDQESAVRDLVRGLVGVLAKKVGAA